MKKEYLKPEAIIVDIELYNSVLEEPDELPASEPATGNHSVWDEDEDRLPSTNKSVWGEDDADKVEMN